MFITINLKHILRRSPFNQLRSIKHVNITQQRIKRLLSILLGSVILCGANIAMAQDGSNGPGVDNTPRPAGTMFKFIDL